MTSPVKFIDVLRAIVCDIPIRIAVGYMRNEKDGVIIMNSTDTII
jgi:hypothetical protein